MKLKNHCCCFVKIKILYSHCVKLSIMVEPTYVSFEQAKKIKELGLVARSDKYWIQTTETEYTEMSDIELENLDRSIGIGSNLVITKYQQWQAIEFLRVNYGICIIVAPRFDNYGNIWYVNECIVLKKNTIKTLNEQLFRGIFTMYISPQEAYSAAIDYTLTNLILCQKKVY